MQVRKLLRTELAILALGALAVATSAHALTAEFASGGNLRICHDPP